LWVIKRKRQNLSPVGHFGGGICNYGFAKRVEKEHIIVIPIFPMLQPFKAFKLQWSHCQSKLQINHC
jgi:hypothetical protein